jgi:hypothetical protein
MAMADLAGGALRNHAYARDLSAATLLARGRLAAPEQKYDDQGFKDFDENEEGDFSDEGRPELRWRAQLVKPDSDLSAEQLFARLAGASSGDPQELIAKLMGGDPTAAALGAAQGSAPGGTAQGGATSTNPLAGMMTGMLQQQLTANMNINSTCNAFWNGTYTSFGHSSVTRLTKDGEVWRAVCKQSDGQGGPNPGQLSDEFTRVLSPAEVERLGRQFDRMFYPEGATRQMAAIIASGERSKGLGALEMPTVVIHGRQDTLIQPSGGERTAELVPGSRLLLLDGMGHDLPAPLWPAIIDAIVANTERSAA